MTDKPYHYAEDSRLLGEALSNLEVGENFLEIGVGGAANLEVVSNKFRLVLGTDLMRLADIERQNNVELIVADRATCFRASVFDVVAFNPPYVPSTTIEDRTVDGGPNGVEVPLAFLESAIAVVKNGGTILLVLSSESKLELFEKFCRDHDLNFNIVEEKKIFYETLYVFQVKKF